jgi:hypothetical protein
LAPDAKRAGGQKESALVTTSIDLHESPRPKADVGRRRSVAVASPWLLACVAFAAAMVVTFFAPRADAIPAFARRYETSCQTCHIAFPRLTPFGEAFRRNGYRFPDGGDATAEKQEPVLLGADAQKDLWPHAVYSGQLPANAPVSIMFEGTAAMGPHIETQMDMSGAAPTAAPKSTLKFDQLGGSARLLSGGTFGPIGSFFASISFGGESPAEVERAVVIFTPIDQTSLHVKVGRFEPSLHGVSIHRGLLGHQLRLTTTMVGDDMFMPEHALKGIELSGLLLGRLGWTAGFVENTTPVDGVFMKDAYARLEAKFGGMRLDGVGGAAGSAAWRERSFSIGASAYRGHAFVGMLDTPTPDDHNEGFVRAGADVHAVLDDLLFDAVVLRQWHDSPLLADPSSRKMDMVYGEVTYMTFPWLFPTARFEASKLRGGAVEQDARWVGILAINTVIRPNLTLRAQAAMGKDPADPKVGFRYTSLSVSAAF